MKKMAERIKTFEVTSKRTDWENYYADHQQSRFNPFRTALISQITRAILSQIPAGHGPLSIAELGGANTPFFKPISARVQIAKFTIFDSCEYGLRLAQETDPRLSSITTDLTRPLSCAEEAKHDVVFSVGLIEHFTGAELRRVLDNHFHLLKPGGTLILSFPTPTWIYRGSRKIAEILNLWKFPDEIPLREAEVAPLAYSNGLRLAASKVLYSTPFTQLFTAFR